MSAGQLPVRHGEGGGRGLLPLHEDGREGRLPKQALGEGEAEQELRQGDDADQREPGVLGGLREAEVQAEAGQDHSVPDTDEETQVEETEEDRAAPAED